MFYFESLKNSSQNYQFYEAKKYSYIEDWKKAWLWCGEIDEHSNYQQRIFCLFCLERLRLDASCRSIFFPPNKPPTLSFRPFLKVTFFSKLCSPYFPSNWKYKQISTLHNFLLETQSPKIEFLYNYNTFTNFLHKR